MTSPSLFPDPVPSPQAKPAGPCASVAIERSLDKVLDYSVPAELAPTIAVGQRVRVPLGRGNKPAHGYVVELPSTSKTTHKLKPVTAIDDERVLLAAPMLELARWMSRYYCCPLGTVIDSVIPAAVKKRIGMEYTTVVSLAATPEKVQQIIEQTKAPKRRAILARLLQVPVGGHEDLAVLATEAGCKSAAIRALAKLGLVKFAEVPVDTVVPVPSPALSGGTAAPASAFGRTDIPVCHASAQVVPVPSPARAGGDATADEGVGTTGPIRIAPVDSPITLNDDQQKALDDILPRLAAGFSVNLLMGVTGSGKTEIYLRCLRQVIEAGKRAIVMVPEIALTPQTVERFTARFPRVAVLHSGLAAGARHRFWRQIASGQADVVVGARSAVFAPVPNLGIIIVDEEHESSYKQDTAPRYHGRDIAIKRAQIERAPIVLGSATPSLETYYRVTTALRSTAVPGSTGVSPVSEGMTDKNVGPAAAAMTDKNSGMTDKNSGMTDKSSRMTDKNVCPTGTPIYHLLTLPRRVRGLALPDVELVDMRIDARIRRGKINLLSTRLEAMLKSTLEAGHQAILMLNRRGYSNYIYCPSCQHLVQCKYCDTTMTFHRSVPAHAHGGTFQEGLHTGQLHCHYCLAVNPLPEKCPACGKGLTLFGLGTQRVEEELAHKFPGVVYARADSDSMRSIHDYEAVLNRFAKGEVQVLLGTQMIAKGLDYPNVTLVGVVSGDTALSLPDFRAAERTFQLITQVAGRAGRGDHPGRVLLQTFQPDDPTLQFAIRQDYVAFATTELGHRRQVGLPPIVRMVRIIVRDQSVEKVQEHSEKLAVYLNAAVAAESGQVTLKGPMPCAINRIAGYNRFQILLFSPTPARLQRVLAAVREQGGFVPADRIAVDVDPVSLL
ncbi:MAG: primosomal protein N' [Tepidisphaerales bacterium]